MSSPGIKNIPLSRIPKSVALIRHPGRPKGTYAIVTERRRGMRWTLQCQAVSLARRNAQRTAKSCGPGAATVASIRAGPCGNGNGDNKRRSPGRARISRQTIARGKPGCFGCTCLIRVRLSTFCTRRCGRGKRPAFPAPFLRRRTTRLQNPGENAPRECGRRASTSVVHPGACVARARNPEYSRCGYRFRARAKRRVPE